MSTMAACPVAFPGEFAGASLKRGYLAGRWYRFRTFPGEFAGASLKRHVGYRPQQK